MTIADWIQIALLVVVIIQLGWAIWSFNKSHRLQIVEMSADHDRRKKEATIAHVNNIRDKYRAMRADLDSKFGEGNVINISDIDEDSTAELKEMLSLMEHLAAGVNSGVFDFDMIYIMSGSYFAGIYERSAPFIKHRRTLKNNPAAYIEFEHMVDLIHERKRNSRDRRADLKSLPV